MAQLPQIQESVAKIETRPEVQAAMAYWKTSLKVKDLQQQIRKTRALVGSFMPPIWNQTQQLRVAHAAVLDLVEKIDAIADVDQYDAALVFAIFAIFHRAQLAPDEADPEREKRVTAKFSELIEEHMSLARASGELPPPSPVPKNPQAVAAFPGDLEELKRSLTDHFAVQLEKQRVAMEEDSRSREKRLRDEQETERRRQQAENEERTRTERAMVEARELRVRIDHEDALRRIARASQDREDTLRREVDARTKSFDDLADADLERLYSEMAIDGEPSQAFNRLGKYGPQHEVTDSDNEDACKKSIIRKIAKTRRAVNDERQRLWYAGYAELATTSEVSAFMHTFKQDIKSGFRFDDEARYDGLVDMLRLVHRLMLRGEKIGRGEKTLTETKTIHAWDPITRRMFFKMWFTLTKQVWELAVMIRYDSNRTLACVEFRAEISRQHTLSLKDWWVVIDFVSAARTIEPAMHRAAAQRRPENPPRGGRGGAGRGGQPRGPSRQPNTPRPQNIDTGARTPRANDRPATPQGEAPRAHKDKDGNWVYP